MKYNILTINDSRNHYKEGIRKNLSLEEVVLPTINGSEVDLDSELRQRQLRLEGWVPKLGEAGVWLSQFDRWVYASENGPLIVFEDDAVVGPDFMDKLNNAIGQLPEDYDFMTLWVPDNQRQDYMYDVTYNDVGEPLIAGHVYSELQSRFNINQPDIALAYQGYGMVATLYSPSGGDNLISSVNKRGICTPVDCFIFQEAHAGRVKGYAPKPSYNIVGYDWQAETTIHNTEEFNAV